MNKKLRICGIDVDLIYSDPGDWATGGMGRCNQSDNRITIRNGMPEDVTNETLLHEVIHMIAATNSLDIQDDEKEVSVLSCSLHAFLRDNFKPLEIK